MKKITKDNKAITLIALVITIIVLLILAGIAVAGLSGNGLFDRTKIAKEKYDNSKKYEDEQIEKYSNEINSRIDSSRETVTISEEDYNKLMNKGKMELLAEQKTKNEYTQFTVKDLKQYSSFVLSIGDGTGTFADLNFTYDELKETLGGSGKVIRIYNSSTTMTRIYYESDTSIRFKLENQSYARFYGII